MSDILQKYANLLVHYCLEIKEGDKLYISTTTLAEPLLREVYRASIKAGALVDFNMSFREQNRIFITEASDAQLDYVLPAFREMMETYDAYLVIRAPFNVKEDASNDPIKSKRRQAALHDVNQIYMERIADRNLKRCLCQYPTQAAAQEANMSLEEYEAFVFGACHLFSPNPAQEWIKVREKQQSVVDYLNQCDQITYRNKHSDITFSVKDRIWINSDGRSNMPSGEVFSSPIEDSVNGVIHFDFPSIYMGNEVDGITLKVKNGQIVEWHADKGQDFLDTIFEMEGTKYFGEVAIGTNYNIQKTTKNILFDEKIGGSVHLAIGQSYKQTGGKNISPVHWDLIADMKDGGTIHADGKLIYQNGEFLI